MGTTTLGHLTEGARSSMKKGITTQKLGTATLGNLPKIPHSLRLGIQPKWVNTTRKNGVQRP